MDGYKKKTGFMASGMMALLSCALFFSCSKEDISVDNGNGSGLACDNICFGITSDGNVQTRGNASGSEKEYTAERFVLRSQDSADTLCVRAIVSDGIESSVSAESQVITRGTPVTVGNFDSFHVLAYWMKGETLVEKFYMDEDVTKTEGNVWSGDRIYYWPGKSNSLQFYAWSPTETDGLTVPTAPTSTTLSYSVPDDATAQQDIVVATTEKIIGNYNNVVPLAFDHICTAVKFVVGKQMQPGTIKSVSLEGVKYAGSYDMATGQWSLTSDSKSFTQTLDKGMTGGETEGSEITATEGTFMMLPQTLPNGAKVEVVFKDGVTGKSRTLEAPIAGMEWPQGKTVTYKLSITPEYEFILSDEDKVLDAHYEIFKTNLIVSGVPAGQPWTVTAPTVNEKVTIQAQGDMNSYSANQGFWTDRNFNQSGYDIGSARGETTFSGTGSGTFPIAIFVPENVGNETRDIQLTIQVNGKNAGMTIDFSQLSPSWFGSLGCERIEEAPTPWGFYWTTDYKLIYDLTACDNTSRRDIYTYVQWSKNLKVASSWPIIGDIIKWIFGDNIPDMSFVDIEKSGTLLNRQADKVTINLGRLQASGIALSPTDGQSNTRDVYNFQGIQYANTLISRLEGISGIVKTSEGEGLNPANNASIACMKLNSWNIYEVQDGFLLKLVGDDANPKWYLPARGEVSGITDTEHPLNGDYWSSTAEDNNTNAFKYSADGTTVTSVLRNEEHNVRAVRKKP